MSQQIAAPATTLEKLAKLADFLEQASRVARELSQTKPSKPAIPTLKRPANIPKDQKWFWSEDWQVGERAVNKALARGDFETFDSAEALIADLHDHV